MTCSPGFYLEKNLFRCLPCHETCLNCTSSNEASCLSCKIGYVYLPDSRRCEKYTGKPYYTDSKTGETRTCHSSCAQCKGPKPDDCIACNPITEVLLNDGHCVNECPSGLYISENKSNDIETNICLPCPTGCKICSHQYLCQECDDKKGYYLKDQNCVPTCEPG